MTQEQLKIKAREYAEKNDHLFWKPVQMVAEQGFLDGATLCQDEMIHKWQVCPICNGSGSSGYDGISVTPVCTVCNGKKIISHLTGLPPE